jgi:hypothetical protein
MHSKSDSLEVYDLIMTVILHYVVGMRVGICVHVVNSYVTTALTLDKLLLPPGLHDQYAPPVRYVSVL